MVDMEKVIKGLPCLTGVPIYCETCPYSDEYGFGWGNRKCAKECASDALELLKKQERQIIELKEKLRLMEYGDQESAQSLLMPAT